MVKVIYMKPAEYSEETWSEERARRIQAERKYRKKAAEKAEIEFWTAVFFFGLVGLVVLIFHLPKISSWVNQFDLLSKVNWWIVAGIYPTAWAVFYAEKKFCFVFRTTKLLQEFSDWRKSRKRRRKERGKRRKEGWIKRHCGIFYRLVGEGIGYGKYPDRRRSAQSEPRFECFTVLVECHNDPTRPDIPQVGEEVCYDPYPEATELFGMTRAAVVRNQ